MKEFNQRFPEARFSRGQLQDKESALKKDYKAIKALRKRSGISWNPRASMISTTTEKWTEIIGEDSNYKRYENKSFPLYDSLSRLYEGQLAEGKYLFHFYPTTY